MSEPWHVDPPARQWELAAQRRYQRALRLSQFARDLESWQRRGLLDHPRYQARIAYRRLCLERWQDYLDGTIAPPATGGRGMQRGN